MTDRPIIFSDEQVRAIMDGRKTQTRRPVTVHWQGGRRVPPYEPWYQETDGKLYFQDEYGDYYPMEQHHLAWSPGDRLWLREAWRIESFMDSIVIGYRSDGGFREIESDSCDEEWHERMCVQSTDELEAMGWDRRDADGFYRWDLGQSPLRWRPSIHMPRCASRITLEVNDVRVERLCEISEVDCVAEGTGLWGCDTQEHFADAWDAINAKRGYAWDTNPWVWVVSFRRCDSE